MDDLNVTDNEPAARPDIPHSEQLQMIRDSVESGHRTLAEGLEFLDRIDADLEGFEQSVALMPIPEGSGDLYTQMRDLSVEGIQRLRQAAKSMKSYLEAEKDGDTDVADQAVQQAREAEELLKQVRDQTAHNLDELLEESQ